MSDLTELTELTELAEPTEPTDTTGMPGATGATGKPQHLLARGWRAFTHFRRTRPFWGALVLALGGYFVARPVLGGSWAFYAAVGAKGMAPMMLGVAMMAAAAVCLLLPAQRHFPSVIAMMLAIASLPLANLGGWIVGMVLGIIGSGLCFAWAPYTDRQLARFAARAERKQQRRAARSAAKQQAAAA